MTLPGKKKNARLWSHPRTLRSPRTQSSRGSVWSMNADTHKHSVVSVSQPPGNTHMVTFAQKHDTDRPAIIHTNLKSAPLSVNAPSSSPFFFYLFILSALDSTLLHVAWQKLMGGGEGFLTAWKARLHHLHVMHLESRTAVDIVTAFHAVRLHTSPRRKDSGFLSIATPTCIRLLCTGAAVCQQQPLGSWERQRPATLGHHWADWQQIFTEAK